MYIEDDDEVDEERLEIGIVETHGKRTRAWEKKVRIIRNDKLISC